MPIIANYQLQEIISEGLGKELESRYFIEPEDAAFDNSLGDV